MIRVKTSLVLTLALVSVCAYSIHADVRTDEKSRVELAGMLGRVVNIFGGKSAREGSPPGEQMRFQIEDFRL